MTPPRPSPIAIGGAIVALALGVASLVARLRGWALEWPLSWLVALTAIVPCGLTLVALAAFVFALREPPRVLRSIPWLAASIGLALAAYGMSGAAQSLNPFDDSLVARGMPPADHATLFVIGDTTGWDVIDLDRPALFAFAPGASARGDADAIGSAWWSPTERDLWLFGRVFATTPDDSGRTELRAATLDGVGRVLIADVGLGDEIATCVRAANRVVCLARDVSGIGWSVITRDPASGALTERHAWHEEPSGRALALWPDGTSVLLSEPCGAGVCLVRSALDGSSREVLGATPHGIAAIAIAPDGTRAAFGMIEDGYEPPQLVGSVGTIELSAPYAMHMIARLPRSSSASGALVGARSLTFSPDGSRLVLLSDEEGCTSYEGFETCSLHLHVMNVDGSTHTNPSTTPSRTGS